MDEQTLIPDVSKLRPSDMLLAKENRDAAISILFGFGSVFSLVLTAIIGSFTADNKGLYFTLIAMGLIISVVIYLTAAKRDERWYVICSLVNHMGIGLAVLMLLRVLEIDLRPLNMALSFLPSSAILCGVSVILLCVGQEYRNRLLWSGIVLELLMILIFLIQFKDRETEFWLMGAVCGVVCCASLSACLWVRANSGSRSVYQALAVVSFAIYLILAIAAAVALLLAAAGNSDSKSSSKRRSRSSSSSSGGKSLAAGNFGSERRSRTAFRTQRYLSNSATHYWLWYTPSGRYRTYDTMEYENPERVTMLKRREHWRTLCVLLIVIVLVIAVFVAAVYFGQG